MIELKNLTVGAGLFRAPAVNFSVPEGRYAILMGRTGSGKTTLLETICGLLPPHAGQILIGGEDVTLKKAAERGVGYAPQDSVLFNALTVREHLSLALEVRRWSKADIARRVDELSQTLHLTTLLKRKPEGLSGGERQRVSLGRALSFRPRVLLLDEPLNALDKGTWENLCGLLRQIHKDTGITVLHVTHHPEEAKLGEIVIQLEEAGTGYSST